MQGEAMFEKFDGYYTDQLRIDLASAAELAALNPSIEPYRAAASRGAFVVSVVQGDIHEGVYSPLFERFFEVLTEAQELYDALVADNPSACCFDFVSGRT